MNTEEIVAYTENESGRFISVFVTIFLPVVMGMEGIIAILERSLVNFMASLLLCSIIGLLLVIFTMFITVLTEILVRLADIFSGKGVSK